MGATRTINIPRLLDVRPRAVESVVPDLREAFDVGRVVVLTGRQASKAVAEELVRHLDRAGTPVVLRSLAGGSFDGAHELGAWLAAEQATLVVAVGGGRVIDLAKLAGRDAQLDVVTVPTTLSHDAMASPVVSLTNPDGRRDSIGAGMPAGVVIDLDVVLDEPVELLRAGVGDLVSNLTALADWRLAADHGAEAFDEFSATIALQSARPMLDLHWPLDLDGIELLARGLVMSGLAMEIAGSSRPCSGAEHLISHSLDRLLGPKARAHGEQVALGVLVAGHLGGADLTPFRDLYERIGLPTAFEGWGIPAEVLVDAIQQAPATRPGRMTVLDHADLARSAIEAVVEDALGGTR